MWRQCQRHRQVRWEIHSLLLPHLPQPAVDAATSGKATNGAIGATAVQAAAAATAAAEPLARWLPSRLRWSLGALSGI